MRTIGLRDVLLFQLAHGASMTAWTIILGAHVSFVTLLPAFSVVVALYVVKADEYFGFQYTSRAAQFAMMILLSTFCAFMLMLVALFLMAFM